MQTVCKLNRILPETGVCALVEGKQVAIFRVNEGGSDKLYAVSNHDPISGADVLSRGIVGGTGDVIYVASPIYKERFNLATGECLDKPEVRIETFAVSVEGDEVLVGSHKS